MIGLDGETAFIHCVGKEYRNQSQISPIIQRNHPDPKGWSVKMLLYFEEE